MSSPTTTGTTPKEPDSPNSVRSGNRDPSLDEQRDHYTTDSLRKPNTRRSRSSWKSVLSGVFTSPQSHPSSSSTSTTSANNTSPTSSISTSNASSVLGQQSLRSSVTSASQTMASSTTTPPRERPRATSLFSSTNSVTASPSSSMTLAPPGTPGSPSPKRQRTVKTSLKSRIFRTKGLQLNPIPGEIPLAVLRVQVLSCKNLFASDRNGKSDPYVVLKLLQQRHKTTVIKSNLNPKWNPKDATFDFPIYESIIKQLAPIFEFVVWDKDLLGKDYLGEISLVMQDWFKDGVPKAFGDPSNAPRWFDLQSSHKKTPAQGSIHLHIGFATPVEQTKTINLTIIYNQLRDYTLSSSTIGGMDVLSAPPTQGIGTLDRDATLDDQFITDEQGRISSSSSSLRRTLSQMSQEEKRRARVSWSGSGGEYNFASDQDIHGVVLLEVTSASDLPKLKNVLTRDGWDNDPFVVVSFGDKIFRTRVIRHELNPVWEEKLVFRVRKEHLKDPNCQISLSVLDWDKLVTNDPVGDATLDLAMILGDEDVPRPEKETGLYAEGKEVATKMKTFRLPLKPGKDAIPDAKHPPIITVRAKFQPHDAMRQRFWRQQLKQVDSNHSKKVARREIMNMAHSLNIDLDKDDVDHFFKERGAVDPKAEISIDDMVIYLENVVAGMNVPYLKAALPAAPTEGQGDGEEKEKEAGADSTSSLPQIIEPPKSPGGPTSGSDSENEISTLLNQSADTIPSMDGSGSLQPKLQIPSGNKGTTALSPLIEVPTPVSANPQLHPHSDSEDSKGKGSNTDRSISPRDQILYGRNRKSIGDLYAQLTEIFEKHPDCTLSDIGTPQVPSRAIIDVLAQFSELHGVTLLNENEAQQLATVTAAIPGLLVTPDVIMEFIAKSTGSVPPVPSPSPPKSPSPASPMLAGEGGAGSTGVGGDAAAGAGHGSASDTDVSEQDEDVKDGKRKVREPSGLDSPRVRKGPLAPPSTWNYTPDTHRRKRSDGSAVGRAALSDTESPSPRKRDSATGRPRAPSDTGAGDLAGSGYSVGSYSRSVPSLPSESQSQSQSQEGDWLFSAGSSLDPAKFEKGQFGMTLSQYWQEHGLPSRLDRIPLPGGSPLLGDPSKMPADDHEHDHGAAGADESPVASDEEDTTANLSLVRSTEQPVKPEVDSTTQEEVDNLQRANQDLTKRLQESAKTLQLRLEDHERELEEYQTRLEEVKAELASTKRDEKELRTKERAGSAQLALLEAEVSKLQRELDRNRTSYQNLQRQYQEQCAEAEKSRNILRRKDEELKDAQEDAASQLNEVRKWKQDRERLEGALSTLQSELRAANQIQDELAEQSRQNDILKETIDRLRFDLDELRTAAARQVTQAVVEAVTKQESADDGHDLGREVNAKLRGMATEEGGSEEDESEGGEESGDDIMETIITTRSRRKVGRGGNKNIVKVTETKEYTSAWTQHEQSEFVDTKPTQTEPEPVVDVATAATQTDVPLETVPETQDMGAQTDEEKTLADPDEQRDEPLASSSLSPPPPRSPSLKGKDKETSTEQEPVMTLPDTFDEPPSYASHEHDPETVAYAEDFLRKWHPGLNNISGIPGGLPPSTSEDWRNIKKEINFECLVIDKVIQASGNAEEKDKVEVEEEEDDDVPDIPALDGPARTEWLPTPPSFVAYPLMLVLGFGVVVFLSAARVVFPPYGSNGVTFTDRRLWNIYNTLPGRFTNGYEGILRQPAFLRGSIARIWFNIFQAVAGMPEVRRVPT